MMVTVRKVLQEGRNVKGLTQQQVADKLGVSLRAYQHYEYEERKLPLDVALQLSTMLDISVYDLSVRNSTSQHESA